MPDVPDTDHRLSDSDSHLYMSVAARLNYLGFDRPDLQFPVKELMRRMSQPTQTDLIALKRVVRYLLTAPRYVSKIPLQELPSTIRVFADANWAGCKKARKSTSGGVIMLGKHCLKTCATTQSLIAK